MRSIAQAVTACLVALVVVASATAAAATATAEYARLEEAVTQTVRPLMATFGIPGMAVGVSVSGRNYVFDYGVASKTTKTRVDRRTLFEVGSITKTFTASLVSHAQLTGTLSLSDRASADFPVLRGTSFDRIRLFNLGTHTAGGLPLQFPDAVKTDGDAIAYYRRWKPSHPAGSYRLYSNPSIMLLGLIAATKMGEAFVAAMQRELLTPVGLRDTFLTVPSDRLRDYAQGYTDADEPIRLSPGPLAPEAYGIRTTASDLLRFLNANMGSLAPGDVLSRAIRETHTGYYRVGTMTQDLIWEQYRYPVALSTLLAGNSERMIFDANRVAAIEPPAAPSEDVWIDKTGSTNGFGAYVAFVPRRKTAIVLLANKSYPIAARVTAAYRIVTRIVR